MESILNPELAHIAARIMGNYQVKPIGRTSRIACESLTCEELERRGLFKRFHDITFENIKRRGIPAQVQSHYLKIETYVAELDEHLKKGVGLILKGGIGTMKTTLAVAVLRQHLEKGGGGQFIPMVSLLDNIFTMKERNKEEWICYEERIRSTSLLVLDDLGAEYHQEWVLSKVDAIVTERYNRMKPIIITTNLNNAELKGRYAERIIDRLKATSLVITFSGESLRGECGKTEC